MKSLYLSIILSFFIGSFAVAQQKGVLQEGYHMPGAVYTQPSNSQTNVHSQPSNSKQNADSNQNSEIKQQYMSEAASSKKKYDSCMTEYDRMPTPRDAFDFSKSLKHKECKRYYDSYMELTSRIIQLEQAGF